MLKICRKCSAKYSKKYHESKNAWSSRMYCSKSCANSETMNGALFTKGQKAWNKGIKLINQSGIKNKNWKGGLVNKYCKQCNSLFTVKPYRKSTAKYCSAKCGHLHRNEGKTPKYKKIRKSFAYKNWIKSIFTRDDFLCQSCGEKSCYLHAHHIMPFALYPNLRTSIDNGISLCTDCHKEIHLFERKNKSFLYNSVQEA